jgi:hypothetical protein
MQLRCFSTTHGEIDEKSRLGLMQDIHIGDVILCLSEPQETGFRYDPAKTEKSFKISQDGKLLELKAVPNTMTNGKATLLSPDLPLGKESSINFKTYVTPSDVSIGLACKLHPLDR